MRGELPPQIPEYRLGRAAEQQPAGSACSDRDRASRLAPKNARLHSRARQEGIPRARKESHSKCRKVNQPTKKELSLKAAPLSLMWNSRREPIYETGFCHFELVNLFSKVFTWLIDQDGFLREKQGREGRFEQRNDHLILSSKADCGPHQAVL